MPKEIWNEGRVCGLSAYEIYVKQHLGEDPSTPPATEREWLASCLAMGSSMLLKVPNVTNRGDKEHSYIDIPLPSNSKLAAANTIVAQFFDGDGSFQGDWATRIVDYGQLISNTSTSSPSGSTVPTQTLTDWDTTKKNQLRDYMHIVDGITIQPGTWVTSENKPPEKDFQANLGAVTAKVRLHVRGNITTNPRVLLTGFTIRSVLAGVTGIDTSTDTESPQDGDFLGPAVFPWASKIVFVVPTSYISYFEESGYERQLKSPTDEAASATQKVIKDTPVIDMQGSKPETFYANYDTYKAYYTSDTANPRYQYNVNDFSTLGDAPTDGEAVLTVYQKKAIYPPALYGTFVGETGTHYLNPLDVVAPGSVKVFNNQAVNVLQDYQNTFHGTTAMNRTSNGTIQVLNSSNKLVEIAGIDQPTFNVTSPTGTTVPVKVLQVNTGKRSGWALSMAQSVAEGNADGTPKAPTPISITQKPSLSITLNDSNANDNIPWSGLMDALTNDKSIDLLGNRLKAAKYTLQKPITGHTSESSAQQKDTSKGSAYLEFGPESGKIRLYICKEAPDPANVPLGSIGIGWGLES